MLDINNSHEIKRLLTGNVKTKLHINVNAAYSACSLHAEATTELK
jgi:hypothetical protein